MATGRERRSRAARRRRAPMALADLDMVVRLPNGRRLTLRFVEVCRFGVLREDKLGREWLTEGDALFGRRAWCCDTGERAEIVAEGGEKAGGG